MYGILLLLPTHGRNPLEHCHRPSFSAVLTRFLTAAKSQDPSLLLLAALAVPLPCGQALGKGGARFTGLVYVFIHYSLLVAYMAQGGGILTEAVQGFLTAG